MKKAIFLTVLISLCFCYVSIARAQTGVQYIGKVCFQLSTTGSPVAQISLEVLSYNTVTLPIHGSIVYSCPCFINECPPIWNPIYGDAVLNNNTVKISLNTSGAGGCAGTLLSSSYSVLFDLGSLKGTFTSTSVQAPGSPGQSPMIQSSSGTVTLTTCP